MARFPLELDRVMVERGLYIPCRVMRKVACWCPVEAGRSQSAAVRLKASSYAP